MTLEWEILIGASGLMVGLIGGIVARDRQLTNTIHANYDSQTKTAKTGDDVLHERINRVRGEMSNDYVRRIDLNTHLDRVERAIAEIKQDMKDERQEMNKRLDAVLQAIQSNLKS